MSFKGTLRTLHAAHNRSESQARKRRNELNRQQVQIEKMQESERANYEVQVFENQLDILLSIHKECGKFWDWNSILSSAPPNKPIKYDTLELLAQSEYEKYKPSIADKLFKRVVSKQEQYLKDIENAKITDERNYQEALKNYETDLEDCKQISIIANGILENNRSSYLEAIKLQNPFTDIREIGPSIEFFYNSKYIEANIRVHDEDIVPTESKSVLQSGKLSVKKIPKTRFYELYQDYVCSVVLRIARELFALLPIDMVIINAIGSILNTQTGYKEEKPILSAAISKNVLEKINFDKIDPADSMGNFVHRMNFNPTKGFTAIECISPDDFSKNE